MSQIKEMAENFAEGSYLNLFFAEKDIPEKVFIKEDEDGMTHFIPNGCVVEAIADSDPDAQKRIADTLRKIDFHDGDVNDFLDHLAGWLAGEMRMT